MPYDWRKPGRLLILQISEMMQEQVVSPAYRASCVLKFVTNQAEGNKFGVKFQGLTEDSRENMAEASATFFDMGVKSQDELDAREEAWACLAGTG